MKRQRTIKEKEKESASYPHHRGAMGACRQAGRSGGHYAPNGKAMETSSVGHARTSHLVGRGRVEEQAPVEQGSEVGDCHRREGL